jgi:hypothetical protein
MKEETITSPSYYPKPDSSQKPVLNHCPIGYNLFVIKLNLNSRIVQRQIYILKILFTGRKEK